MTYAPDQRQFIVHRQASASDRSRSSAAYRAWRTLAPDRRMALIERRLNASGDLADGFPLAL
ncbi:MAG TPA: hypothetical protein VF637_16035 [Sphingomicrobium sp.]|jgi:hypothetical protein